MELLRGATRGQASPRARNPCSLVAPNLAWDARRMSCVGSARDGGRRCGGSHGHSAASLCRRGPCRGWNRSSRGVKKSRAQEVLRKSHQLCRQAFETLSTRSKSMNTMPKRTIAIGDIHGSSTAQKALIEAIRPRPEDTIVTLGDYINRGPDSRGVLDLLIGLSRRCRLVRSWATTTQGSSRSGSGSIRLTGGSTSVIPTTSSDAPRQNSHNGPVIGPGQRNFVQPSGGRPPSCPLLPLRGLLFGGTRKCANVLCGQPIQEGIRQ